MWSPPPPQRKIDSGFDLTLHFIVKYAGSLKAKIQHSLPNKKSTDLQRAAIFQHLLGGFLQNLQGSNESPMHTSNIYIYIYIDMGIVHVIVYNYWTLNDIGMYYIVI